MMDGTLREQLHREGAEARGSAGRFRAWRRMTEARAHGWALLLAEGMPGNAPELQAALAREIEAYARQLLWSRFRSRGMSPAHLARGGSIEPRRLHGVAGAESAIPEAPIETDRSQPGEAESAGGTLSQPNSSRPYTPPLVTREVFDRFCRWTGMDPGCLGGPEEHQAGLVFYLVVFAMLTGPGGSPDLPSLRLFKKLRQCREQLTRQAEAFFHEDRGAFPPAPSKLSPAARRVNDPTSGTAREGLSADRRIR